MAEPMKFAYADPPYLGCASYYKAHHPDAMIWNKPETHRALIERLQDEFPDGWAMSLSEKSLRVILPMCPSDIRMGVWLTDRARFAPKLAVHRYFEPVLWRGGRSYAQTGARTRDCVITPQQKQPPNTNRYQAFYKDRQRDQGEFFLGRKPAAFCEWMFDLLGAGPGDEFHDLFPGSGAVSAAWAKRIAGPLPGELTPLEKIAAHGVPIPESRRTARKAGAS